MKAGRIERATVRRKAKVLVLAARTDDQGTRELAQCLERLHLLRRARPLKGRPGYLLAVTVVEFDRLRNSPEVGGLEAST